MNFTVESGGMKELEFGGCFAFNFWKRCRGGFILLGKLVDPQVNLKRYCTSGEVLV